MPRKQLDGLIFVKRDPYYDNFYSQADSSKTGKRSNANQELDDSDLSSDDETSSQKIDKQKGKVRIEFWYVVWDESNTAAFV